MIRLVQKFIGEESWEKTRPQIAQFMRDVSRILNGGFVWDEQVRNVRGCFINTANYPAGMTYEGSFVPKFVVLLRATKQGEPESVFYSGGLVKWEARGGRVLVHNVEGLDANSKYDAIFAVME